MIRCESAQASDIPAIAELFQNAFPEALLAVFGKSRLPVRAVEDLFRAIYRFECQGFFVARQKNGLAGFILVTVHLKRLYRRLVFGGIIPAMILRWGTGRYPGLGFGFVPRLAKLWWDYRHLEKQPDLKADAAQVLSIVVEAKARKQGIGRQLTERALQYLQGTPAKTVRLEVDAAKPGPIHLYETFGFREVARLSTPRGPALVMVLPLHRSPY